MKEFFIPPISKSKKPKAKSRVKPTFKNVLRKKAAHKNSPFGWTFGFWCQKTKPKAQPNRPIIYKPLTLNWVGGESSCLSIVFSVDLQCYKPGFFPSWLPKLTCTLPSRWWKDLKAIFICFCVPRNHSLIRLCWHFSNEPARSMGFMLVSIHAHAWGMCFMRNI